ncbi:gliding motility-associated lipoprotein GldB [Saonia flava]|uniref:Gliding motility-associated lipoprotein GldB n=1 Tax=Saonia flava TaxID=523696 RepID=A0A846QV43_9FLAO|nr:gliding motility lipoprotein GldB [Saonia flava]NJB70810.1 gliding motility-associated lipoprotein GldB [Saonia flava]
MYKPFFIVFLLFLFLTSCNDNDKIAKEIENISLNLQISRFDREFAETTPEQLADLKNKYLYLFPKQYPDSVWISKMTDTLQIELLSEVNTTFGDFEQESADLELLFKHIKYYFPHFETPKVVTVISDVQYQNRVVLADSLLLIGLDNYLGGSHKFYTGIQRYIAQGLDKEYIISDVASAFAKIVVKPSKDRSFLSQMIFYGKELYLKDKLIPFKTDAQKIGYTEEQLDWAKANEEQTWRYFIERELLYSTDSKLGPRFLDPAPFSKFQLEIIDNESPGRIGRYMGWQIVRAFMDDNDVTLEQLLNLPEEEIFKESNYKPTK